MLEEIVGVIGTSLWMIIGIAIIFAIYLGISFLCNLAWNLFTSSRDKARGFNSLKTVTFGDESAVVANRFASVLSVVAIFFLWGLATGSAWLPISLPKPFVGQTSFQYTATNASGETADATVFIDVFAQNGGTSVVPELPAVDAPGFAKNDAISVSERRSKILKAQDNDIGGDQEGFRITAINGQPVEPEQTVSFSDGEILMTRRGSLSIKPSTGMTMEALFLPPPEQVVARFGELVQTGYQGVGLAENLAWSLIRVVIGFALGCLFGIPLGFAIGLNSWLRGWFDPIVEFMRPVPPLALIPLVIIWFGIGEQGKISLLFLAALWIMAIAARAGVSGTKISKVHAAYSLGASKKQVLMKVLLPNSLPEIFTGARVAMGVCWGTVVAAELVAAEKGAGKMIIAASKFQLTDIVIIGIIMIGIVGFAIEVLMRKIEDRLIPWKGKG